MKAEREQKIASAKIFIEADDEIIDIVDQIAEAESSQILLILPKHSLIGSSTVNLKLLARRLVNLKKVAILISSSELITNKAHEAFLICKAKVEQVDQLVWKDAYKFLQELEENLKERKNKFILVRKEKEIEQHNESQEMTTTVPTNSESNTHDVDNTKLSEQAPDSEFEHEVEKDTLPRIYSSSVNKQTVIKIGGFAFLPGGDIKGIDVRDNNVDDEETDKKKEIPATNPVKSANTLIGHDISSLNDSTIKKYSYQNSNRSRKPGFLGKLLKRLSILIILLSPLLLFYRSYAEKLEITIEVESKAVELSQQVTGNLDIKTIDITTKKIPVKKITVTKSMSDSAPTTGEALKGEKATGVMDFFNKTQKEIILPAGTALTTINKNLTFYLNAQAKIPAAVSEITPSKLESIPIIAAEPGEQYNISDTDVKIAGFNPNGELSGRIFRPVKGGTSEKIKVLAQEDIDKLKATLTSTITKLLEQEIDKSINPDEIKLAGTEKTIETKLEITPKVGEEAEEFSILALEYETSALIIDQDDLDELADRLIIEKYNLDELSEIDSTQKATFEDLKIINDNEISFAVRKEGKIKTDINDSIIKAAIEGENIDNLGSKLAEIKEIKDYQIHYTPDFLPRFLHRVPSNKDKIVIDIKSS